MTSSRTVPLLSHATRRPAFLLAAAFVAGTLLYGPYGSVAVPAGVGALALFRLGKAHDRKWIPILLAMCLFGFLRFHAMALFLEEMELLGEGERSFYGRVEEVGKTDRGSVWTVRILDVGNRRYPSWQAVRGRFFQEGDLEAAPGDLVRFRSRPQLIPAPSNPGAFNQRTYRFARSTYIQGDMEGAFLLPGTGRGPLAWRHGFHRLERAALEKVLEPRHLGMLETILLARKDLLEEEDLESFRVGGLSHLLAVSGLHTGILVLGFHWMARRLTGSRVLGTVLAFFFLLAYSFLAGGGFSIQRAGAMLFLFLLAPFQGERYDGLSALSLVCLVWTAYNPWILRDAGFLLSVSAVLGILVVLPVLEDSFNPDRRPLAQGLLVSLSATLCTLPVLVLYFHRIPLYGILANLLAVPVFGGVVLLCVLVLCLAWTWTPLAVFFSASLVHLLDYLVGVGDFFGNLPGGTWVPGVLQGWGMVFYVLWLGGHLLLLSRWSWTHTRRLHLLVLLGFLVALSCHQTWREGRLEVVFLDVGQGDAAFFSHGGETFLVDGGGLRHLEETNTGRRVVAKALESKGIGRLSGVFLSHSDYDHSQGVLELLEDMEVGFLAVSRLYADQRDLQLEPLLVKAEEMGVALHHLHPGDGIQVGALAVTDVSPPLEAGEVVKNNDRSLVLRLDLGEFSLGFTGDVESLAENRMADGALAGVDLLKVPHHGAGTSSGQGWLDRIGPKAAVFSYGRNNPYGHPSPEVLLRYEEAGALGLHTALQGAVAATTDGKGGFRLEVQNPRGQSLAIKERGLW
ncbi:DNA internalization-related competence protein ComEC/Rec2 [Anaerotalea alkaliphila]|uniref:DNA internalization-related competence protein ComEC/Rec2 n=1 Tax=Anaerotalea alkaliphila TaxID=2662126 RepID=A0A7X5KLP3_9FIRM|nr:DNA internalization-related competence protein ComEC/Rec2 [Anaerotalea alkaliphila]NDL66904.1 DNA internalization-related competence protein ComEC/Rec2 [Anaerotalea alkaliphila]